MYEMRNSWTDDRLDGFATHVDQRFDAVDQRFDVVDQRFDAIDQRFSRVEADMRDLRTEMNSRFDRVDERFEALHRLMVQFCSVAIAALIGLIATHI